MLKLLILVMISIDAFALERQQIYLASCQTHYAKAKSDLSKEIPASKVKEFAKELCQLLKKQWDRENLWSKMGNPEFSGCWTAMDLIYADEKESNLKKERILKLQRKYCFE